MKKSKSSNDQEISQEDLNKIQIDAQSLADKINNADDNGEHQIMVTVEELKVVLLLQKVFFTYLHVLQLLKNSKKAVKSLRRILFGKNDETSKSRKNKKNNDESKNNDQGDSNDNDCDGQSSGSNVKSGKDSSFDEGHNGENKDGQVAEGKDLNKNPDDKKRKGGGGKNSIDSYTSAIIISCPLNPEHQPGCMCPACQENKLYSRQDKLTLKLVGMAPVMAFRFNQETSECICGAQFYGEIPKEFQDLFNEKKYSPSALSSMVHLKVDLGLSYGGVGKYQNDHGCPLPPSTQANKIADTKRVMEALYKNLIKYGVNKDIVGFDDTNNIILEGRLTKDGKTTNHAYGSVFAFRDAGPDENNIIIYTINDVHAGKDFLSFLSLRNPDLKALIAISDGLPAYQKYKEATVDVNCNVHSRRQFFNEDPRGENLLCNLIINYYKTIFKNEEHCNIHGLSANQRMSYHNQHSKEALDKIFQVCRFMMMPPLPDPKVERLELELPDYIVPAQPNSDLYKAAKYFIDREAHLSEFLKTSGVPLHTNLEERMIKKLINLEKHSLFFKTKDSAHHAAMALSLIQTAKEYEVSSFDYLEFVFANEEQAIKNPDAFMPWTYQAHPSYQLRRPFLSNLQQMMRSLGRRCSEELKAWRDPLALPHFQPASD